MGISSDIFKELGLDMSSSYLTKLVDNKPIQERILELQKEINFFTENSNLSESPEKKQYFLEKVTTNFPNESTTEKDYRAKNCFDIWSIITSEFSVWYGELSRNINSDFSYYDILRNILTNPNGFYSVIDTHTEEFPKNEKLSLENVFVSFENVLYLDSENIVFSYESNIYHLTENYQTTVILPIKNERIVKYITIPYSNIGRKYGTFGVFANELGFFDCLLSDSFKYASDYLKNKSFSDFEKYKTSTQVFEQLVGCDTCNGSGFVDMGGRDGQCGKCGGHGVISNSQFVRNVISRNEEPPQNIFQTVDSSYIKEIFEQTKYAYELFQQSIFADSQKVFQSEKTKEINNEKYYSFLNTVGYKIVEILSNLQNFQNELQPEQKEFVYLFSPLTFEPAITVNEIKELRDSNSPNSQVFAAELRYLKQQKYSETEIKKAQLVNYFTNGYNTKDIIELVSTQLISSEGANFIMGIERKINDLILSMGADVFGKTDLGVLIQKLKSQ